ncbi:hypothetical protein CARUB_v10005432mg [Capsella rubella]|uniref:Cystatin domain-containing protein n=1 Tax=Capsella rubella TaxID=81985 RepID=R0GJV2_9BRAS|nr:hypothetical protein CARUB_v10005432mg [Capsella rubella]
MGEEDDDDEKVTEFWVRVEESQGFDVEHLMETKPEWCLLHYETSDFDSEVLLYAKFGIHNYNMLQGKNLQLSCIEKCNTRPNYAFSRYYITLVAKDPAAGGSFVPFQTKVFEQGCKNIKTLAVCIARVKSESQENPELPGSVYDCAQVSLPDEWPSEDSFSDKKRYYVVRLAILLLLMTQFNCDLFAFSLYTYTDEEIGGAKT